MLVFLLIVGLVVLGLLSWITWSAFENDRELIGSIGATLVSCGAIIILVISITIAVKFIGAEARTAVLNSSFGTKYTVEQVMWADDIIQQTIQGPKSRVELTVDKKGDK